MDIKDLTLQIKQEARQLGFSLVGITNPEPPDHLKFFQNWLSAGYQASMQWIDAERSRERRSDPRKILPECKSIISLGIPYADPQKVNGKGGISAYALNQDYHDVLPEKLKSLVKFLEERVGHPIPNRWYTDTGPILEREIAMRAGLGWIGKNTTLINREYGSYFFLAEILLGVDLISDSPITESFCGSCTRCLEACPTGSLVKAYTLDANLCTSYLTIEHREFIPLEMRALMGEWIFGCDVCQAVCPWNKSVKESPEVIDDFQPRPELAAVDLIAEMHLTQQAFSARFKGSPIKRTKRRGYLRNVAVALGNRTAADSQRILTAALNDEEALVRSHAAWALGEIGGENYLESLKDHLTRETDPGVIDSIQKIIKEI